MCPEFLKKNPLLLTFSDIATIKFVSTPFQNEVMSPCVLLHRKLNLSLFLGLLKGLYLNSRLAYTLSALHVAAAGNRFSRRCHSNQIAPRLSLVTARVNDRVKGSPR